MDANAAKKQGCSILGAPGPGTQKTNRVRVKLISEGRMFQRIGTMIEKAHTSPGPHQPTFLG